MGEAASNHNRLAPELVKQLIGGTSDESDAMVLLESVCLGVMLFYRPKPREAGEFLDVMTQRIIERMKP